MLKRVVDILVSGVALVALSPLLLSVMVLLRFTGEGKVFYRQERIGRRSQRFHIYKFATMFEDSPHMAGGDITVGDDPRILPVGRVLRRTKINELPQLFNILCGDMSLIGPRPLTPRVVCLFPENYWAALSEWRPGLSGVASIVFRDEEKILQGVEDRELAYTNAIVPYKSKLDQWYVQNQSFWLDLKLVFFTVVALGSQRFNLARFLRDLPEPPPGLAALRRQGGRMPRCIPLGPPAAAPNPCVRRNEAGNVSLAVPVREATRPSLRSAGRR